MDCSESSWKLLATLSIRLFPLHFSSRASPFPLYNVAFWRVRVNTFQWKHPRIPCVFLFLLLLFLVVVVDQHVIVNNTKNFSVAQQCLYRKFMSPKTIKIIRINLVKETLSQLIFTLSDIAYKQCTATNEQKQTYFPTDTQAANRIWLPTQPRHYTTREKIPLSRQLLKMGTMWPKTCWATYKEK